MLHTERGQTSAMIVIICVVIIFFAAIYLASRSEDKISIIERRFDDDKRVPGESATLTVRIKNVASEGMARGVTVTISPSKSFIEVQGQDSITIGTLDSGEESWLDFSIAISQDATYGKWKVKISTSADSPFKGDNKEIFITVESAT